MEFLRDHKTWIVLNGGLSENVSSLLLFLQDNEHRLQRAIPYAPFYEDQKSLSGIMTCVGLILPEEYFSAVPAGTIPTVPLGDYASGDIERDDYVFIVEKDGVAEIKQLWRVGSPDWELINRVKSCSLAR